jgi:uncharacterized damage-inducible protein DinB
MTTTMTSPDRKSQASLAQALLQEFEQELGTTRRFLQRVPGDKLTWKPHEKSLTTGQLALHVATTPAGVLALASPEIAEAPDASSFEQPRSVEQILAALDECAATVRDSLPEVSDQRMREKFTVTRDGQVTLAVPRIDFLRLIMLNHWYHHRGQLGVYLRLLGAKVPSSYGPSGDENPFLAR